MRPISISCVSVLLLAAVSCAPQKAVVSAKESYPDKTIDVVHNDKEMAAAIAKARSTLPDFFKHWQHPGKGESDFALNIKLSEDGENEYFWVSQLQGTPGHLSAVIDSAPEYVHSVKLGERIKFTDSQITDWTYWRDGKMFGNETIRPLFKQMPPDEVKAVKAKMANP